jgi:UDP-N-acetylglucosamine--N-acetylmuramyl-(pentapeptide) pyrophosphoryl-undecaprenol N-acetylglucosamine transferase
MGHIAPLVAVMEEVARLDSEIELAYAGLYADLASPALESCNLKFSRHAVSAGKLNRFATPKHFLEVLKLGKGFSDALQLLLELRPKVVFCKGGYVSFPLATVAKLMGIPVFSHESDAVPGLANKLLTKLSKQVFTAYPEKTYVSLPHHKLAYVGQPVRKQFFTKSQLPKNIGDDFTILPDVPLLFVTSSQGARKLNQLVSSNWKLLLSTYQIIQQCGALDYTSLLELKLKLPQELQKRLCLVVSLVDLPPYLQNAEVVVSRSGGIIAELAASKAASLLVPLSTAAQNHQWENAKVLVQAEAAVVIDETTATAESFLAAIMRLHRSKALRDDLKRNIFSFAKPKAAESIAKVLVAVAK